MICSAPLTEQQKKKSQRNFYYFNVMNGVSYMCLGETILTLLAVKMNSPDSVISTLGAMLYFGFLMLPLGKMAAAKLGGAGSQGFFWIFRNIAAAAVGLSAVLSYFGMQNIAIVLLVTGTFFFYGFRAAGVVMGQPLIGEITDENGTAKLIAVANGIFFFFRMTTLIVLTLIVNKSDSLWTLVAIIFFGSVCGVTSSKFLRNIDETDAISSSAKKPIAPDIKWSLLNPSMRKQIMAGFAFNLSWIMTIPTTSLAMKRGYDASDADVLIFTICFSAGCCIMSFAGGYIAKTLGPRKLFLLSYLMLILSSAIWFILPTKVSFAYMCFHYFFQGTAGIWGNNAAPEYFLKTVPKKRQVGAAIVLAVFSGVISGLTGILITGLLLEAVPEFTATPLDGYKLYFVLTTVILIPGILFFKNLTPLDIDKNYSSRHLLARISSFISHRH